VWKTQLDARTEGFEQLDQPANPRVFVSRGDGVPRGQRPIDRDQCNLCRAERVVEELGRLGRSVVADQRAIDLRSDQEVIPGYDFEP
jgi:hypothetical protein